MAAMDEYLMVGGEDGSYTFMNLQTCDNPVFDSFTTVHYLEVNGIEITRSRTGSMLFIQCNQLSQQSRRQRSHKPG